MSEHAVEFRLNGRPVRVLVEASASLVEVLRDQIGLTGTKLGCGAGVCGVCSVIVDGSLQTACLVPAVHLDGTSVSTIEGVADADGSLAPIQRAFIEQGGFQCGICTPGQVMAATALLRERPNPSEDEIVDWMKGSLCRCTGYYGIVRAVQAASGEGR
ncbi:MAG: (2Fe-2S)-binding protein [Acidothermales bacterium]|nr:(2Fe-2S)-binding protein [Acidothermales bacterium]